MSNVKTDEVNKLNQTSDEVDTTEVKPDEVDTTEVSTKTSDEFVNNTVDTSTDDDDKNIDELESKVESLTKNLAKADLNTTYERLLNDGKITPAEKDDFLSWSEYASKPDGQSLINRVVEIYSKRVANKKLVETEAGSSKEQSAKVDVSAVQKFSGVNAERQDELSKKYNI